MRRSSGVFFSALVLAFVAVPAALAGKPIAPNQAFEANVNGSSGGAVVHVACAANAQSGQPLSGQYVQAKKEKVVPDVEPSPFGFTGDATSILVTESPFLVPNPAATAAILVVAQLKRYGRKAAIPATLPLPCSGSGEFAFRPVDGGQGAVTAFVPVTFEP